jgi:hypothetical protein
VAARKEEHLAIDWLEENQKRGGWGGTKGSRKQRACGKTCVRVAKHARVRRIIGCTRSSMIGWVSHFADFAGDGVRQLAHETCDKAGLPELDGPRRQRQQRADDARRPRSKYASLDIRTNSSLSVSQCVIRTTPPLRTAPKR